MKMLNIKIILGLLLISQFSFLSACSKKKPKSSSVSSLSTKPVDTISDQLLEINGQIILQPPSQKDLTSDILMNISGDLKHYPDDPSTNALKWNLLNLDSSDSTLALASEALGMSDPILAVKEQLNYTIMIGDKRTRILFNESSLQVRKSPSKNNVYDYYINGFLLDPPSSQIEAKDVKIVFPKNPFTIFTKTTNFKDVGQVEKFSRLKTACAAGEIDSVPRDFCRYFDPYSNSQCQSKYQDDLIEVTDIKVSSQPSLKRYPEFQELFSDNQLDIYLLIDGEGAQKTGKVHLAALREYLINKQNFTVSSSSNKNDIILTKQIGSDSQKMAINIRLVLNLSAITDLSDKFKKSDLWKYEIFILDSLSSGQNNLSKLFDISTNYPKNKYQIFVPLINHKANETYSQILSAKAVTNLDLDDYYADILALSVSPVAKAEGDAIDPMTTTIDGVLDFFLSSAAAFDSDKIKDFSYQDLAIKITSVDNASPGTQVHILGEDKNIFTPSSPKPERPQSKFTDSQLDLFLATYAGDEYKDLRTRQLAAERIFLRNGAALQPKLLNLLDHFNPEIRRAVSWGITASGKFVNNDTVNSSIIYTLESETNTENRMIALEMTGRLKEVNYQIVSDLLKIAETENLQNELSWKTIEVLGSVNAQKDDLKPILETYLKKSLENKDLSTQQRTVFRALLRTKIMDETLLGITTEAYSNATDVDTKAAMLDYMSLQKPVNNGFIKALVNELTSSDADLTIKIAILKTFGAWKDSSTEITTALLNALDSKEEMFSIAAIQAAGLSTTKNKDIIAKIQTLSESGNSSQKHFAIEALERLN